MTYLFYLFIFLLSLGQLQRVSLFNGAVNFYLHEIIMLLFIVFSFLWGERVKKNHLFIPAAIFILALLISLIKGFWQFTLFQNMVGLFFILRLCLYFIFFASLSKLHKKIIETGLKFYALMIIALSFISFFLFPKLFSLIPLGWDPHEYRMVGTFFDVSIAGVVYILFLFFTLFQSLRNSKNILHKGSLLQAGIFLLLILLTYSRITYLALFAAIAFLLIYKAPLKNILLSLILFLILIAIIPRQTRGESNRLERTFSIHSRLYDIQEGILLWQSHPLLGVGYNRIKYYRSRPAGALPDHAASSFSSSFVTIGAGGGMVGLLALLYLLFEVYRKTSLWGKIILVPVFIASNLDNVLPHPLVLAPLLLLIFFVSND